MSPLFTASSEDIERLNAQEAVDFFRKLLWAEARRINLTLNKIHVAKDINVADGGVDATVEDYDGSIPSGLIKSGWEHLNLALSINTQEKSEIK